MKLSNLYIVLIAIVLLIGISYYTLNKDVQTEIVQKELPVAEKEFVWVRTDSLVNSIVRMTTGNVKIDSSKSSKLILSYHSKQYLLHERTDGMNTLRKHLLDKAGDYFEMKENNENVIITLKREDGYTYCPAAILGRVLQSMSKNQN